MHDDELRAVLRRIERRQKTTYVGLLAVLVLISPQIVENFGATEERIGIARLLAWVGLGLAVTALGMALSALRRGDR